MKAETRNCQNCKNDFTIEPDDFGFYEKIKVPPPTFCPDCRFQRRLVFRNNRVFYKRECARCNKQILAVYSKDKPYVVYCKECWLSDGWDPIQYGSGYDFSKSFFDQFKNLQLKVPRTNLYQTNFISSEYCNYGKDLRDCYLLFGGINNDHVYFANQILDSRDSLDVSFSEKLEFCYENFECARNNKLFFSHQSQDCVDSYYLVDCRNCINCFGCVGLVNKQYHIFNQQYSRDEYLKFIESNKGSYQNHLSNLGKLNELYLSLPHRYARIYKSVNSDGDDLYEARNTHNSFSSRQVENCKFLFFNRNIAKDCYDISFQGYGAELLYEIAHGFGGSNSAFGVRNFNNRDSHYNEECHECSNVFGCEGLMKKSYCILNKQYTKEEYEELLPRIIEQMQEMPYVDKMGKVYKYGEFFPSDISPFAYNETIAQEYFPLSKEEGTSRGYKWKDSEIRNYQIDIENKDISDNINETTEDILSKVIACAHAGDCMDQCTEAFKIVLEEFKFYKRMGLPLPRLCPNCRHYERIKQRNPLKLWRRRCMKEGCQNEFETSYAPDRPEIVYCEKCYQQEVY